MIKIDLHHYEIDSVEEWPTEQGYITPLYEFKNMEGVEKFIETRQHALRVDSHFGECVRIVYHDATDNGYILVHVYHKRCGRVIIASSYLVWGLDK